LVQVVLLALLLELVAMDLFLFWVFLQRLLVE
jgi:hypothetical protein